MSQSIILASSSPYRRQLLARLNIAFEQYAPQVDESLIQRSNATAQQKAEQLALLKAQTVLAQFPQAVVIGGDQIAALGDEILLKPGSPDNALAQLSLLSGRSHCLYTAIAVVSAERCDVFTDIARLQMKRHTQAQLQAYIDRDEPYDCAGSYKYEASGHQLFDSVQCDDATAIQGLPLQRLALMLGMPSKGL